MLGVAVLFTSTELKVVRNYLWALWIADLGHVGLTAYLLGYDRFMAVGNWNAMTWGNIGATVRSTESTFIVDPLTCLQTFLCLTRTAYLLGLFGETRPVTSLKKSK
jgi:hypothetical protein